MTYRFRLPGIPQPKGSTRGYIRGGRVVLVSDNARLAAWHQEAVLTVRQGVRGRPKLAGALVVRARFLMPAPKRRTRERPSVRPDLDKLLRAALDVLTQGEAIGDDGQVVALWATKVYGVPGVEVRVREMEPGRSARVAPAARS